MTGALSIGSPLQAVSCANPSIAVSVSKSCSAFIASKSIHLAGTASEPSQNVLHPGLPKSRQKLPVSQKLGCATSSADLAAALCPCLPPPTGQRHPDLPAQHDLRVPSAEKQLAQAEGHAVYDCAMHRQPAAGSRHSASSRQLTTGLSSECMLPDCRSQCRSQCAMHRQPACKEPHQEAAPARKPRPVFFRALIAAAVSSMSITPRSPL